MPESATVTVASSPPATVTRDRAPFGRVLEGVADNIGQNALQPLLRGADQQLFCRRVHRHLQPLLCRFRSQPPQHGLEDLLHGDCPQRRLFAYRLTRRQVQQVVNERQQAVQPPLKAPQYLALLRRHLPH
jgi:hypothetical protein